MLRKQFVFFFFLSTIFCAEIFKLDLSEGYQIQFEAFQETAYAKDEIDAATSDAVIAFSQLSKYSGIVQKEWMKSINGIYFISILFKGEAGKRSGGYLGYIRSDSENIYRTIGLDYDYFMDVYQFYEFKAGEGTWSRYQSYLQVPVGVKVKLILEQGSFFGISTKYYAAFKEIEVTDTEWKDECPGSDQQDKNSYFTALFEGMDLANKVWTEMSLKDDKSVGYFTFNYIDFKAPCVVPQFYILDKEGEVINNFEQTQATELDLNYYFVKTWKYSFTLSQIESANCLEEEIDCEKDGIVEKCKNYTCNWNFHFYYDLGAETEFNTLAEEFAYSNANAQVKYNGDFSVIVFKENSTILNTVIYTKMVDETMCTGKCQINMDLSLGLKVKFSEDEDWETPLQTAKEVVWGDNLDIKIESNPKSGYQLSIMEIYATTENAQNIQLGDTFINSFLKNTNNENEGELTFQMRVSGEAGNINKGKIYNLKFLVKTTPISSRLLADETELPLAQQTDNDIKISVLNANDIKISVKEDNSTETDDAQKMWVGIAFIMLLLCLFI